MRICLVYDCLFPYTVGGARALVPEPRRSGWPPTATRSPTSRCASGSAASAAEVPGVRVVAAGPRMRCTAARGSAASCRRSCSAPASSGTCCATAGATTSCTPPRSRTSRCSRRRWSGACARSASSSTGSSSGARTTGARYLGGRRRAGSAGWCSARCLRVPQHAFASPSSPPRGCAPKGCAATSTVLRGLYAGPTSPARGRCRPSRSSVFAGRHIPEKRAPAVVPAVAHARRAHPGAARAHPRRRAGPRRGARGDRGARRRGRRRGAGLRRDRGRSSTTSAARCASCCRRSREGYGLVVVEACVDGDPERAGRRRGQRGHRADRGGRQRLRRGERRRRRRSPPRSCASMRRAARCAPRPPAWFARNAARLSIDASLDAVAAGYASGSARS